MTLKRGHLRKEPAIFAKSKPGHSGYSLDRKTPEVSDIPESYLRIKAPKLPELSEVEVIRHYTRLSHWNHAIELGSYPLGSCTMKYNPKINESMARLPGFSRLHPLQDESEMQGALELMYNLEKSLCSLSGFARVTLQPSAGANGEFTGLSIIRKAIMEKGEDKTRNIILIPDTAHGTNPASVVLNGFTPVGVSTGSHGFLTAEAVRPYLNEQLAGIMVTNPNTLGIYERELKDIAALVHEAGGYVYMDGANFNAIMGKVKPAQIGVDTMHFNLHKTFSTPHGGGGPGAGPVGVTRELAKFLPVPVIEKSDNTYHIRYSSEKTVGKLHPFYGNFAVLVRAYAYIKELGEQGLYTVTDRAVLNARYVRVKLEPILELGYKEDTLHEAVFTDRTLKKETTCSTMNVAKRMLDFGVHPPTVYFPLIVPGAFMVEPTETESKEDLDTLTEIIENIIAECKSEPETVLNAPRNTGIGRLDETWAARKKILRYTAPE
ncbi:MAG: aminomethyl-transferring glycine dehydrogenase subunit GcvPB [Deltaproteobacteria bacterium]|nr:aminomethyl-transferring glycine dehydrogenase subunit GcvPB [Deltaproteobacteria bacterium]